MSKNQQYAQQHAEYAMEQMRKYGIPASVILAQGILESSNGQSDLARKENNHFGIKATKDWLARGGKYGVYTDDAPDEKFCSYDSVADSYEHHSRFLKENKRYEQCFSLSPDDYKGWSKGLERAGYATGGAYAANLQRIIELNGLDRYDKMVMEEMKAKGLKPGGQESDTAQTRKGGYSFPVERQEFMLVTSAFGQRQDPMDPSKQQMHQGIDIQTKGDRLLATEDGAKVVAVNHNAATAGGKSVTLEYEREDGAKMQCTYMHMSDIHVKVGDTLNAGDAVGLSGNTGTRTTGEHLHFSVTSVSADGHSRQIDPAAYLADVAQKGNIGVQVLHNGEDLLARYQPQQEQGQQQTKAVSPEDWMKKLLCSEDSGLGLGGQVGDPIVNLMVELFMGIMSLVSMLEGNKEKAAMEKATQAAVEKTISLVSIVPGMKQCDISYQDGKMTLSADNGKVQFTHTLSDAESSRLVQTLSDSGLGADEKRQRLANLVAGITASYQVSQNFQQGMDASQGREAEMRMR